MNTNDDQPFLNPFWDAQGQKDPTPNHQIGWKLASPSPGPALGPTLFFCLSHGPAGSEPLRLSDVPACFRGIIPCAEPDCPSDVLDAQDNREGLPDDQDAPATLEDALTLLTVLDDGFQKLVPAILNLQSRVEQIEAVGEWGIREAGPRIAKLETRLEYLIPAIRGMNDLVSSVSMTLDRASGEFFAMNDRLNGQAAVIHQLTQHLDDHEQRLLSLDVHPFEQRLVAVERFLSRLADAGDMGELADLLTSGRGLVNRDGD